MQDAIIKTRPDGSIDTTYYMEKGRLERSRAAYEMARKVTNAPAEATARGTKGLIASLFARIAPAFSREFRAS